MEECNRLCKRNEGTCLYCQEHYIVSEEFYVAERAVNNEKVVGYLIKNKNGEIEGILTKSSDYNELAWIKEDTLVEENLLESDESQLNPTPVVEEKSEKPEVKEKPKVKELSDYERGLRDGYARAVEDCTGGGWRFYNG